MVTPLSAAAAKKATLKAKKHNVPINGGSWDVYKAALSYFDGKRYDTFEWLGHPSAALEGETPLDRAKTPGGTQEGTRPDWSLGAWDPDVKVWRIAKSRYARTIKQMLSGDGAARFGGRWNPKGVPAVYCSENSSLAALEVLVNLARPSAFPAHSVLDLDVPDEAIAFAPSTSPDTRATGAAILRDHLALAAPSAVNPLERNVVINPLHRDFGRVVAGNIQPFVFDERLRV